MTSTPALIPCEIKSEYFFFFTYFFYCLYYCMSSQTGWFDRLFREAGYYMLTVAFGFTCEAHSTC